jgi:hypothetical protein
MFFKDHIDNTFLQSHIHEVLQNIRLKVETVEDLIEFKKKHRLFELNAGSVNFAPSAESIENVYDKALLFTKECTDILCSNAIIMSVAEATKKIALFLGSEVVNPDITPLEFDATLDTIPEEILVKALINLALSYKKNPEILEVTMEEYGGPRN